jgi:hypothetical protein
MMVAETRDDVSTSQGQLATQKLRERPEIDSPSKGESNCQNLISD